MNSNIDDAKIAKSILIWENKNLSKALRNWRENEKTPDVTPEIIPSVAKPEVSQSYYSSNEYTNSQDDYDSDTERELYRYSINPNSLYMD